MGTVRVCMELIPPLFEIIIVPPRLQGSGGGGGCPGGMMTEEGGGASSLRLHPVAKSARIAKTMILDIDVLSLLALPLRRLYTSFGTVAITLGSFVGILKCSTSSTLCQCL